MDDILLQRIANVCNYYRGATWRLSYTSAEGGTWALMLEATPPPDAPAEAESMHPFLPMIFVRSDEPVFAIRCHNLEVVATAVEHWHASTLTKDLG